jgi:uncharacterized membrane protein YfcA
MFDLLAAGRTPGELLCLIVAAGLAGLARGFSGFGAALIFMPLASAAIGPRLAAPLLLIIDAVMAVGLIPNAWRQADRHAVGVMAAGAMIGVPLGTLALKVAHPTPLRWAIALMVVALLALLISGWRYRGKPRPWLTLAVGGLSGLCGGAAQISGPPVMAYWLGGTLPIQHVRANIVIFFLCSTIFSAVSYFLGGLLVGPVFILALACGPFYGAGVLAGARLFSRANERTFRWLSYALIGLAALVSLPALDAILR